jgi:uncharacterized protein YceH (UPF0502 family)
MSPFVLSQEECRVLGSLIEKQRTTPEYYPMTINAILNACNQKTNRDPVVQYDETTIEIALEGLHRKGLVSNVSGSGLRSIKYAHLLDFKTQLDDASIAIMCVLLLRGPQTPGELRGRTNRMYDFKDLHEAESCLSSLAVSDPPYVIRLPKLPGTKENRYSHLMAGPIDLDAIEHNFQQSNTMVPSVLDEFRSEIEHLKSEIETLKERLDALVRDLS